MLRNCRVECRIIPDVSKTTIEESMMATDSSLHFLTDDFLVDPGLFSGPVLVTGAGGCIGSWVCSILTRSGVKVIASDLKRSPDRASLIIGPDAADALDWVALDVTSGSAVSDLIESRGVCAIIHLAGLQVPFCAANPAMGARVNVEGTINILEAAKNAGVKRTVFASSVAAHGFPAGGPYKETLYGAYKVANEQTAYVYWADWQVPSICLRPNVVYGVARDQGMSSKNTIGIQAAALGLPYDISFVGDYSWLYAGEAAAAFIASVSVDGKDARVFDLNGRCETIEAGVDVLKRLDSNSQVTCSGNPWPFPAALDDAPLRAYVAEYPDISVENGVEATYRAFKELQRQGRLPSLPA